MNSSVVIPIGGKGTRLKEITGNTPKPIFPILGKSTLYRACENLVNQGFSKIIVTSGYESEECIDHVNYISQKLNIKIDLYQEDKPLGESGALWRIQKLLSEEFFFINGDLIFSIDLLRVFNFHKRLDSDLTLVTHTSNHPSDSDLISAPNGSNVERIFLKNDKSHFLVNAYLGFSAIALISKKLLFDVDPPNEIQYSSIFHHLVRKSIDKSFKIFSYNTSEYIKDMGTPRRFKEAQMAITENKLKKHNYQNKQKALFIDRDNTIINCKKGEYILVDSNIEFLIENIEKLSIKANEFTMVILVTNQPQIGMGILSLEELEIINSKIVSFCLELNLKIDVITFCPHHPHKGFLNEISSLKTDCFCRKPNPGLFLEQAFLRNIDLAESLMVGDQYTDKLAAHNSGTSFCYINDL